MQIKVDTLTNAMIWKKLILKPVGERLFDIPLAEILEAYFGEYSMTMKAYKT